MLNEGVPTAHYITGSVRSQENGRGRFDLVPPEFIARLAVRLEAGAEKYGEHNWEKGQPLSRYLSSLNRHILQFTVGMTNEDHLAAAEFNLAALQWTLAMVLQGKLPDVLNDINAPQDNLKFVYFLSPDE